MRNAPPLLGAALALLAACGPPLPSERIAGSFEAEVAGLRANLGTACTPQETDILIEELAILADASQAGTLSASQRRAIETRNAAFTESYRTVSPACRARLDELAGPSPFSR